METYLYKDLYQLEDKHWWHIAKREEVAKLIFKFNYKKGLKILDIGCGTGKNIEAFADLGQVLGVDNNAKALHFCEKRGIKVKLGSADKTGFPKDSFDIVTLLDVLEHTDEAKTLREVYKILKPTGIMIITVPALPQLWSRWDEVLHHKKRYTKKDLENILDQNKFNILKLSFMYSFLVIPIFIIRFIKTIIFKKKYSSDFRLINPITNTILLKVARLERIILNSIGLPIGTSLVAVVVKK